MNLTPRHRRAARTLWECGGQLDDAARRMRVRPATLRKWLRDPDFRTLVAEDAFEPVLQATSAMLRWAPVAVARLIQDLESESASDARQAAREILKLALDTQRELARPINTRPPDANPPAGPADDPLGRRVAALSDDQLTRVLDILNETTQAARGPAQPTNGPFSRDPKGSGHSPETTPHAKPQGRQEPHGLKGKGDPS